jgi:cyclic pyranopterin phosphate synthase
MSEFTHFDSQGHAVMVDVGNKEKTERVATARGHICMSPDCFERVKSGLISKGDVLSVARLSGIMAVKHTSSLIPLCHTLLIEKAHVDFELNESDFSITAFCTVKTTGTTGVEMEALSGVSIALLTIYDMCKAVDKGMEIKDIHLLKKTGGKSGTYERKN